MIYPFIGQELPVLEFPKIKKHGYAFCGTWHSVAGSNNYRLIGITWQNTKTGKVITHQQFLQLEKE